MKKIFLMVFGYVLIIAPMFLVDDMSGIGLSSYMVNILLGLIGSVIIHELGHYYYGKKTGYKFQSFRILWLLIYKDSNDKTKVKFTKIPAGILGQCIMKPTNDEYVMYNKGGYLFNIYAIIFLTIICIPLLFIYQPIIPAICYSISMHLMCYCTNGMVGRIPNDASNLKSINENKEVLPYFKEQLKIVATLNNDSTMKSYDCTPIKNELIVDCCFIYSNIYFGYVDAYYKGTSKEYIDNIDVDYGALQKYANNFYYIYVLKMIQLVIVENNKEEAIKLYIDTFNYNRILEGVVVGHILVLYKLVLSILFNKEVKYRNTIVKTLSKAKTAYKFESIFITDLLSRYEDIKEDNTYKNAKLKYAVVIDIKNNQGKLLTFKKGNIEYKDCIVDTDKEIFTGFIITKTKDTIKVGYSK